MQSINKLGAAIIGVLAAATCHADSVTGKFQLDGKALEPTDVAAFRVRDSKDPRRQATLVMLTTKPVDRETIAKDTDPFAVAINDPATSGADFLSLRVGPDDIATINAYVGGVQYMDTSGTMMGQPGSLTSSCTTNTPKRVACTVRSAKPVKTSSGPSWTVDVTFDSEVLARTPGPALPKGGGEPGTAFLALVAAVAADDIAKILAQLPPDDAAQPEYQSAEEHHASIRQRFAYGFPMKPTIIGGELLDENTALLDVEGERPGRRDLYLVRMERTEGRWGFRSSLQLGRLPEGSRP